MSNERRRSYENGLFFLASAVTGFGMGWALLTTFPAFRQWPAVVLTLSSFLACIPAEFRTQRGWQGLLRWLPFLANAVAFDTLFSWRARMFAEWGDYRGPGSVLPGPPVSVVIALVLAGVVGIMFVSLALHRRQR
jgi:hypothetical protein